VKEQALALENQGLDIGYFPIIGRGLRGYWSSYLNLRQKLRETHFDIIHGHYIWSVIICLFHRKIKKIGTFHGTDLNVRKYRILAKYFVIPLLDKAIVVNPTMARLMKNKRIEVIPCGVDTDIFYPRDTSKEVRKLKGWKDEYVNILFSSNFDRYEKNYPLAKAAVESLSKTHKINLIELKGYTREEVAILLNSVDLMLLTSLWEGSPQVVKEAMACNCPVVSTDVGDVRWLLDNVENCHICGLNADEISNKIVTVNSKGQRSNGRERILCLGLDLPTIALRILDLYTLV